MKTKIGDSAAGQPKAKRRWSIWVENGIYYTAPTVNPRKFGKHAYAIEGEYMRGIHDCPCGCYMMNYSSGGPVDPDGACPSNPKKE